VFRNGRLTQSFKTALIKLIPKKGNSADIKKWRPISLLSCLYKIISRAVNNRLKSVVNRFTSRAQKGFTKHRYIQEVLINVCETIRHCDTNNIGAALVSVDQSRAFDTISHKYMSEVYKFFGFGELFVNMMDTLGNNRNASIIFEDGTTSENFGLETGRPQGDGPSPLQYNMGEEILLLKIELDPLVASVFQHALAPRFAMDLVPDPRRKGLDVDYNEHLSQESNRETDKADGFADDNSNAVKAEFESLNRLKTLCHEFALFSGLQSNVEKTTLLKIGNTNVLSQEILNLGFNITEEVVLLGMTINRNLDSLQNHFDEVILKIIRMIEFWERFKLSMCGRISVCKTFMISQIGYLGCIITPSQGQTNRLQKLLDDFCTGSSRIAKKKLYMPPGLGGLGLIKVHDYIISLQCSWIKRITQHWGDNWRFDIKEKCYGNPLIAVGQTFSSREHPVKSNICCSFEKFAAAFTKKDSNYKKAYIFKNPLIRRGERDNGLLCENFFGRNNSFETFSKIAKLKYEDFFGRNGTKTLHSVNMEYDLNFSLVTFMRLHEALRFYSRQYENNDGPAQSLQFFIKSFDKGSKPFRRILQHAETSRIAVAGINTVQTFFSLTDLDKPEEKILRFLWSDWNNGFFSNRCREFLFKFRNNTLGLNSRVCKFVNNVDAECTFCVANKEPLPINAESFVHLFFNCHVNEKYRVKIENTLFPEIVNKNDTIRRNFWFLGKMPGGGNFNPFISAIVNVVNHLIWEMKLRKEMQPVSVFYEDVKYAVHKLLKVKFLREAKQNDIFFVCRHTFDPP
jgi:hypothetical protein